QRRRHLRHDHADLTSADGGAAQGRGPASSILAIAFPLRSRHQQTLLILGFNEPGEQLMLLGDFTSPPSKERLMQNRHAMLMLLGAALTAVCGPSSVSAQLVTVYGGPTYDQTTQTGYQISSLHHFTAGNGVAVLGASKRIGGTSLGSRALRWDASGS